MKKIWLLAFLLFLFTAAWGQTTDYQLQIGCATLGCSTGIGTGSIAGEVNALTGNTLTIFENGNGSPNVEDPVLLIIGVPNGAGTFVPPNVTAVNGSAVTPFGPGLAGGAWGWNGSSAGVAFNSSNGGDAYGALGLGSGKTGQASESFGNWQTANSQLGLSTTGYTLYVYAIYGTNLQGGATASVTFGSALPPGTFVIGYSCSVGSQTDPCTQKGDNLGATPFTVSGEQGGSVPEPATMALLGVSGVFGLVGIVRRKFSR